MMPGQTRLLKKITAALTAVALSSGTLAWAQSEAAKVRAGILTCKGKGDVGLILGSKEALNCTLAPAGGGPKTNYVGTLTRIGIDIGFRGENTMVWAVLSSSNELPGEDLNGNYGGVAADASLGLGAGAQVLVGGSRKSITLQPLSATGEKGLNIAAGVAGLTLRSKH